MSTQIRWFKSVTIEQLQAVARGTMMEHLGIIYTKLTDEMLEAKMPVDTRTKQNFGLLHGGASVALAETLGSAAGNLCVDFEKYQCVGIEVNANHLRSAKDGYVIGQATPLHQGKSIQVWEIKIYDEKDLLVCTSRLTLAVIPRRP